jgi:uncharacterized protein YbjT (DUF2867 family)
MQDMILVYGATGTQGGPIADQLLTQGRRVRVITRERTRAGHLAARGADVVVADLGDRDSLAAANEGVDQVVLQLPLQYDFDLHERYGRNAVDAARAAGVELVVFNTSAQVVPGTQVHAYQARQQVVDYLQSSGLSNIVLRPTFYMEIFLGPWIRPGIVEQSVLAFPLPPNFPMSWVSARELGAYAVAALRHPGLSGRTFDIGGPQPLTGEDLAAVFSTRLQRPVATCPSPQTTTSAPSCPCSGPQSPPKSPRRSAA